jgi:hypothetical protein
MFGLERLKEDEKDEGEAKRRAESILQSVRERGIFREPSAVTKLVSLDWLHQLLALFMLINRCPEKKDNVVKLI